MKNNEFQDDGRVLADMTGVERRPVFLPRLRPDRNSRAGSASRSEFSPEDRRIVMRGAIRASLLIAGVFIGGMAAVIALLQLFWNGL